MNIHDLQEADVKFNGSKVNVHNAMPTSLVGWAVFSVAVAIFEGLKLIAKAINAK